MFKLLNAFNIHFCGFFCQIVHREFHTNNLTTAALKKIVLSLITNDKITSQLTTNALTWFCEFSFTCDEYEKPKDVVKNSE